MYGKNFRTKFVTHMWRILYSKISYKIPHTCVRNFVRDFVWEIWRFVKYFRTKSFTHMWRILYSKISYKIPHTCVKDFVRDFVWEILGYVKYFRTKLLTHKGVLWSISYEQNFRTKFVIHVLDVLYDKNFRIKLLTHRGEVFRANKISAQNFSHMCDKQTRPVWNFFWIRGWNKKVNKYGEVNG